RGNPPLRSRLLRRREHRAPRRSFHLCRACDFLRKKAYRRKPAPRSLCKRYLPYHKRSQHAWYSSLSHDVNNVVTASLVWALLWFCVFSLVERATRTDRKSVV